VPNARLARWRALAVNVSEVFADGLRPAAWQQGIRIAARANWVQPKFKTDRLDVYSVCCERPSGFYSPTVYLAFHRRRDSYPHHWTVACAVVNDDQVIWIETPHLSREGFALELLNGIASHLDLKQPLYEDTTIGHGGALIEAHKRWFAERHAAECPGVTDTR
jgi:hypothetical protein